MSKKQLRELFLCRMYLEIQLFKDRLLNADKEAIFRAAYQIEIMADLYEILVEESERMPDMFLRKLLSVHEGILESFYQEWLKSEDGAYAELKAYVSRELSDYYENMEIIVGDKKRLRKGGQKGKVLWRNISYGCLGRMR